ncbi:MAG: hypothetical protein JNJ54_12285 [Myxococcaceae bacterium]|nr:hypothetical protein [Myxococcaceae bacterium]
MLTPALALTACFTPIPEADTGLTTVVVKPGRGPGDGGLAAEPGDAGHPFRAPPVTTTVDRLVPNPTAAVSDGSTTPLVGGCRGDAYRAGVQRPPECVGRQCLFVIGNDGRVRVLDSGHEGYTVLGTSDSHVAWTRQVGRLRSLMVSSGGAPRQVATSTTGAVFVRFDGADLLLVETMGTGGGGSTRVTRYADGQAESLRQVVLEAPGARSSSPERVAVDAAGRVWLLTDVGLFRSAPRGQPTSTTQVPLVGGPSGARPSAFALLPSGLALVALANELWLTDGTASRLDQVATLPSGAPVMAVAPWRSGFAAVAGAEVFVHDGSGPIVRVLGRNPASPYSTTEPALSVTREGRLLVSTLCLSWSSYPGYDVAVLDLSPDGDSARWWWEVFPSQFDVPAFPVARANVRGDEWTSVELHRTSLGFVTSLLP